MKSIVFVVLAAGLLVTANAQEKQTPHVPRPPYRNDQRKQGNELLLQRLQLTSAQREQLKKEQEQALEKVLTADQKKKLKEIRQQQQQRKEEMEARQRQQLKDRLSLTDDQATKLQDLQKNFMESMKKNRQQLDQTIAQQRERTRELMETHQQSLKKLLSAEQLDRFRMMMRDKMRDGMQRFRDRTGGYEQRPPEDRRPHMNRRAPAERRMPPPNGTNSDVRADTL
jgi:chromosome segregation ATPase